jgi:hypothetical protein
MRFLKHVHHHPSKISSGKNEKEEQEQEEEVGEL